MVRLATVLFKRNLGKIKKVQFEKKGEYKINLFSKTVRETLQERNINVVSAEEILGLSDGKPKFKWEKPDDLLPDYRNPPPEVDNSVPIGEKTKNFLVSNQISFTKGIKQACILTNTQDFNGLPPFVEHLMNKYTIPKQKLMVQKAIMQSQVWNATREKLPKRVDLRKIGFVFKREYGIPDSKSASILLDSFLHNAGFLMKDFPKSLDRSLVYKPEVQTVYKWNECNIQINSVNECMLLSDRRLPLFADSTLVKSTVDHKFEDMYPIRPTIDLIPIKELTVDGIDRGALTEPLMFPQTVFRITGAHKHNNYIQAYNLMNTYGIALAEARQRFKKTSGDLPYPICIQNVNLTYNRLNFIYFQLNTLDTVNENGFKNTAWFHTERLFSKTPCTPWENKDWSLSPPVYGDFNEKAFKTFLATYLYGIA